MGDSGVYCTIAPPFIGDVGRGWCRLHPEVMKKLSVSSGAAVLVSDGIHSAAYYAHPVVEEPNWADKEDKQLIQLDFHTVTGETPAETEGREVVVRPVTPSPARSVVYQDLPPRNGTRNRRSPYAGRSPRDARSRRDENMDFVLERQFQHRWRGAGGL
jgi:hypothetical protein